MFGAYGIIHVTSKPYHTATPVLYWQDCCSIHTKEQRLIIPNHEPWRSRKSTQGKKSEIWSFWEFGSLGSLGTISVELGSTSVTCHTCGLVATRVAKCVHKYQYPCAYILSIGPALMPHHSAHDIHTSHSSRSVIGRAVQCFCFTAEYTVLCQRDWLHGVHIDRRGCQCICYSVFGRCGSRAEMSVAYILDPWALEPGGHYVTTRIIDTYCSHFVPMVSPSLREFCPMGPDDPR